MPLDDTLTIALPEAPPTRARGIPWASLLLAGLYLLHYSQMGVAGVSLTRVVRFGGDFGPFLTRAQEWWRLGTTAFIHYTPTQLGVSLFFLAVSGMALQERLGFWRTVGFYALGAGICGGVSVFFQHAFSLGAATGLFALCGASLAADLWLGPVVLVGYNIYLAWSLAYVDPWAAVAAFVLGICLRRTGGKLTVLGGLGFFLLVGGLAYGLYQAPGFDLARYPTTRFETPDYSIEVPVYMKTEMAQNGPQWIGPGINGFVTSAPITTYAPVRLAEARDEMVELIKTDVTVDRYDVVMVGRRPWLVADVLNRLVELRGQRALSTAGKSRVYVLTMYANGDDLEVLKKLLPQLLQGFQPKADPGLLTAQLHFESALELLQRGDKKGAVSEFDLALAGHDFADAYYHRGWTRKFSDRKGALGDLSKAIELRPDVAHYYQYRAALYAAQKQNELAIADLDKALKLNPKAATVQTKGYLYGMMGRYKEAIKTTEDAIQQAYKEGVTVDELADMRANLSIWKRSSGDARGGVETASQALDDKRISGGARAKLYYERAEAYADLKDHQAALTDLDEALKLDSSMTLAHSLRAELLDKLGKRKEAIAAFKACIETGEAGASYVESARKRLAELNAP